MPSDDAGRSADPNETAPAGGTAKTEDRFPAGEPGQTDDPIPAGEPGQTDDPIPAGESGQTGDPTPAGEAGQTGDPTPAGESGQTGDPTPVAETVQTDDPAAAKPSGTTGDTAPTGEPLDLDDTAPAGEPLDLDDTAPTGEPLDLDDTAPAGEAAQVAGERRNVFAIAGRALRHRNFRLFTVGQSISLIGTWMQQVAVGWLVYRLTDSAFLLGLVGFVAQGPTFVLAPIAGVLADRYNKRTLVILTQAGMMVQAFVLAGLVLTDTVTIGAIVLLMGVLGALSGLDIPARQSFLVEMVDDREDLPNAIALNSSVFNGARLLGPAVAGLVVAAVGEGICILINAVSYVAVLASLFMMRTPARVVDRGPVLGQLISEGFRYVYGFRPLRSILLLVAFVSLVAVPFTVLLPVVATDVLGGGAETLGFLMAAVGLGALAGALYLASRTTVRGLSRVIVSAALLFGVSLVALALSRTLWLSLVCLAVAGFGMMAQMASSNTVLQTIVDDDKRGRVMSMYSMAYIGIAPLGALAGGAMASAFGAPQTIALGGLGCMLGALVFARQLPALRAQIRPIYARLGIIPEVAGGIQAATHNTRPRTGDR